jgi:hypothetical protein
MDMNNVMYFDTFLVKQSLNHLQALFFKGISCEVAIIVCIEHNPLGTSFPTNLCQEVVASPHKWAFDYDKSFTC